MVEFSWSFHNILIFTTTIPESKETNGFPLSQELADTIVLLQVFDSRSRAHLMTVHFVSTQPVLHSVASTVWLVHPMSKTDFRPCPVVFVAWRVNDYLQ